MAWLWPLWNILPRKSRVMFFSLQHQTRKSNMTSTALNLRSSNQIKMWHGAPLKYCTMYIPHTCIYLLDNWDSTREFACQYTIYHRKCHISQNQVVSFELESVKNISCDKANNPSTRERSIWLRWFRWFKRTLVLAFQQKKLLFRVVWANSPWYIGLSRCWWSSYISNR